MNDSQKHMMVDKSNRPIEWLTVIFILKKTLMQNTHTHAHKQTGSCYSSFSSSCSPSYV